MATKFSKNSTTLGSATLIKKVSELTPGTGVDNIPANTGMTQVYNSETRDYENVDAYLELQGTDGGMLFNRMTYDQMQALKAAEGMKVFVTDSDKKGFYSYINGAWGIDNAGGGGSVTSVTAKYPNNQMDITTDSSGNVKVAIQDNPYFSGIVSTYVTPGTSNGFVVQSSTPPSFLKKKKLSTVPVSASFYTDGGDFETASGNITTGSGHITTASGNIKTSVGNIEATTGTITGYALPGNSAIIASSGDVEANTGNIIAGTDVIAGNNITTTNGTITGKNIASTQKITAGTGIDVITGTINAPNSALNVASIDINGTGTLSSVVSGITAGTNVTITGTATNPIINASGSSGGGTVTNVSGTSGQITVANGTTTPVLSFPTSVTMPGSLATTGALNVGTNISASGSITGTNLTISESFQGATIAATNNVSTNSITPTSSTGTISIGSPLNTSTTNILGALQLNGTPISTGGGTVTSVSGTTNQISVANGTTTPTLSLPTNLIAPGNVSTSNGSIYAGGVNGSIGSNTTITAGTTINTLNGSITAGGVNGSISATSTITAGTGIIATTGDIKASNGNVVTSRIQAIATGGTLTLGDSGGAGITNVVGTLELNGVPVSTASGTVTSVATGVGLSGGPITTSGTISLANTSVTPGTYTNATVTVDNMGRLTNASSGVNPVTSIVSGNTSNITIGGTTTAPTVDLSSTAVSSGSYTNANITVDAKGRITSASSGTGGSGTVTSVSGTTNQISVTNSTTTPVLSLSSALVAPGSITATSTILATTNIATSNGSISAGGANGSIVANKTITAGTGITATTGNISTANGSITAGGTNGSISATSTITAGTGLTITNGDAQIPAGNVILSGPSAFVRASAIKPTSSSGILQIGEGDGFSVTNLIDTVRINSTDIDTYINNLISALFRTGTVPVGDIGSTGTVTLSPTGAVQGATKRNGYNSSDCFLDITYSDKGYIPNIFVFVLNNMSSSNANDIGVPVLQSRSNTGARIYLEETQSVIQNITLQIILTSPNII